MLFEKDTDEPFWGKYTADRINVGGRLYPIEIELDEDEIDDWILKSLEEQERSKLYKAPANGRYRPA